MPEYPLIMTADEAAEMLRVSKQTVYEEATSGRLPARRIGRAWRFYRPAVLAYLQAADRVEQTRDDQ